MDHQIVNLLKFLPNYEEIKHLIVDHLEAHHVLSMASKNIKHILEENEKYSQVNLSSTEIEEASFLVEAMSIKLWEAIHSEKFCEVPLERRKIYTVSCYYNIVYSLISNHDTQQLEKCSYKLDIALLVGYSDGICDKCDQFKNAMMKFLDANLDASKDINIPYIEPIEHKELPCDIPILESPSIEDFKVNHFIPLQPALLRGTINDWPALTKWRDLSYILKIAGNRSVPIEIGTNYTSDDWSQRLMKIRDFLKRQFEETSSDDELEVEYLAQHELFDHVPILREDIHCPSYCSLGEQPDKVDIKAWLGPKGTISPMHQDPKHNILCQVFGTKHIILASPDDSKFLYPHEFEFFLNTSQINAEQLDLDEFPLAKNVKFYHLTLQESECLYLPPKWWHYIRSEAKSFSVSFWWQ